MLRSLTSMIKKPGTAPGSVVYTGTKEITEPITITVFSYTPEGYDLQENVSLDHLEDHRTSTSTTWINVDGVHDSDLVRAIGRQFGIHALVLEDLASPNQRPKLEIYEDYLFIVMKMPHYVEGERIRIEQVCLLLGDNWVFSFQEDPVDIFEPVRKRIRHGQGLIRKMGADYLAYALLDTVIDHYFMIAEAIGERIEDLELALLDDEGPGQSVMHQINDLKRMVGTLRQAIWPFRELVKGMNKDEVPLIHEKTQVFLADVSDHITQIVDLVEIARERLQDLTNLYMTKINNRMNEVMKTLTIVGGIFIPLTFIAGIYGMNFNHMPELQWTGGYYMALGVMAGTALGLVLYFRRKGWF